MVYKDALACHRTCNFISCCIGHRSVITFKNLENKKCGRL
jgi:hypothetical protein